MKPILVLLPGLDGSGQLFSPLIAALSADFECRVLALPSDGEQTQTALAQRLIPQLPKQPFVLLGESFSGAIAVQIAGAKPPGLIGLILVATFLQSPRPWLLKMPKPVVRFCWQLHRQLAALWWPFCGYRQDIGTRRLVLKSLQSLPWPTLWRRLQAIRTMPAGPSAIAYPAISIQPQEDYLVPPSARVLLHQLAATQCIKGPHFLLQSEPVAAASVIRDWCALTFPETD